MTKLALYSPSPYTAPSSFPTSSSLTLASDMRIQTTADIATALEKRWMLWEEHGEEVLQVLRQVDRSYEKEVEAELQREHEVERVSEVAPEASVVPSQHDKPWIDLTYHTSVCYRQVTLSRFLHAAVC